MAIKSEIKTNHCKAKARPLLEKYAILHKYSFPLQIHHKITIIQTF